MTSGVKDFTAERWDRLNSATKYPSILTYHEIGKGGRLTEELRVDFDGAEVIEVTEKIDGTNARILVFPSGEIVIGSRTGWITYVGDVIANPAENIAVATAPVIERIRKYLDDVVVPDTVVALFGEAYGFGTSSGAREYTKTEGVAGFRLFDVARIPLDVLEREKADIASWRDHGGQPFMRATDVAAVAGIVGLDTVPLLDEVRQLPTSLVATRDWLGRELPEGRTRAALDASGRGRSEGVVVRTPDRSLIAKIRFVDYARTLG